MRKITFLFIAFFFTTTSIQAQDTIASCVWGRSPNTGNTMLTEYLDGDSVFITAWYANGTIRNPRTFSGYYNVSHDTVTFFEEPGMICGPDTAVYIFTLDTTGARDKYFVTLVNDFCSGRITWHTAFNTIYPCYEKTNPMFNTCWTFFHNNGEYTLRELTEDNKVYETEYDHNGFTTASRQQKGWYYNSYDTIIFVDPGATCLDSGVYTVTFVGHDRASFLMQSDPCTTRQTSIIGADSIFICKAKPIGFEEVVLVESNYRIYPNPASSSIVIENLKHEFDEETKIILFDLLGNKLIEQNMGEAGSTFTLNVAHLMAGVYILQIANKNEVLITERIIIQK